MRGKKSLSRCSRKVCSSLCFRLDFRKRW